MATELCKGIDLDSYISEPASLPLQSAADSILIRIAETSGQNATISPIPIIITVVKDLDFLGTLVLVCGILAFLLLSCLCLPRCCKPNKGGQILGIGSVWALCCGIYLFMKFNSVQTSLSNGLDAGLCSAGLAVDGFVNGHQATDPHGFPGVPALRDITVDTLSDVSSRVKSLGSDGASLLADEVQSVYDYLEDDRQVWDKLGNITLHNPYHPNGSDPTLAGLGLIGKLKAAINASLQEIKETGAHALENASHDLVLGINTWSTQLEEADMNEFLGNISLVQQNIYDAKAAVDAQVPSLGAKYILVVLVMFLLSCVSCCACTCRKAGLPGGFFAGMCFSGCICASLLPLVIFVVVFFLSSVLGVPCELLHAPTVADVTVPTAMMMYTTKFDDDDIRKTLLQSVMSPVMTTVAGTCLAGRNNGQLVNALLGPHHKWKALTRCVTYLPHESLKLLAYGADLQLNYALFNKTIACLHQASFVESLLPQSEVTRDKFDTWWENHINSSATLPVADINKMIVTAREGLVKHADQMVKEFIKKTCNETLSKYHYKDTHNMTKRCQHAFEQTRKDFIGNVSSIAKDEISSESLVAFLSKFTRELPQKMEPIATNLGNVFSLIDDKLLSRLNCGLIAETLSNVVEGSVCSTAGLAGALLAFKKVIFAIMLLFYSASLIFLGACLSVQKQSQARTRVDMDHEPLLQF